MNPERLYYLTFIAAIKAGHDVLTSHTMAEEAIRLRRPWDIEPEPKPKLEGTASLQVVVDALPNTASGKQAAFLHCVTYLIQHINTSQGYYCTGSYLHRDRACNKAVGGTANSNHLHRRAIDLNLFKDGVYQKTTEAHRPFGEWWEALGMSLKLNFRWGGNFKNNPDGNHYELHL